MPLSRREFLTKTTAVAALLSAAKTARADPSPLRASYTPKARPPNILYVIQEDVGPNHACYGEPLIKTPHIDRFASQGIRFKNAFCTAPVCSASRSALMTGCFQTFVGSHQHRTWERNKRPLPSPVRHICDWFRDAGYFTCNLQPKGSHGKGTNGGHFGARGSGKIDLNFVISDPKPGNPFDADDWDERAPDQPFFAHVTIFETHKGGGWKLARQQPKDELVDPEKLTLPPYYPDHPVARDEYANYLDALHMSDGYFGQLLARIERDGLADNTIVVLSSDHGPLFRGKQFVYDNGLRIPLIIRFPDGYRAGTVEDRLVSGVDLAPTMLGMAGIVPPRGAMQGVDLFAAGAPDRQRIFAARDRMDTAIDRMRVVRTPDFKYIRNFLPAVPYMQSNPYKERNYPTWNLVKELKKAGKLTPEAALFAAETKPVEELYDLRTDPHELKNLASDPAHIAILNQLREEMDTWEKATDRGLNYEDPVDIYQGYEVAEAVPPKPGSGA